MIFTCSSSRRSRLRHAAVAIGLILAPVWAQQSMQRQVSAYDDIEQITDAVLISNVAVSGETISCGLFIKPPAVIQPVAPFQASGDWLQQMTISLVNRTNEPIVAGGIIFHFMDTGDCRSIPCIGTGLRFGQVPKIDAYDGRTGKPLDPQQRGSQAIEWRPETTIVIHVGEYMKQIESELADFAPASEITKVKLYRGPFYFQNGMKWNLGSYSVPDPQRPGKFKELPADYFPGRRGNNWPPGFSY